MREYVWAVKLAVSVILSYVWAQAQGLLRPTVSSLLPCQHPHLGLRVRERVRLRDRVELPLRVLLPDRVRDGLRLADAAV